MVRDFRNFHFEQLADQSGVRTGQRDGRALGTAVYVHHEGTQAASVEVLLARNLLGRRQQCLHSPKVDLNHVRVVALLDHAGHKLALTALEFAQHVVVFNVAKALQNDLAGRTGSDAAKTCRGVLELADGLTVVVDFRGPDGHVAALAIQFRAGLLEGPGRLVIRHQQRLLDGGNQEIQRDFTLTLQESQCAHVNIH
ncbi:hypothetical protein D3C73_1142890 [compost metagenome]